MTIYFSLGSPQTVITSKELREYLHTTLATLGPRRRVLAIPPDATRFHSRAGELTQYVWEYYREKLTDVLPALGTHTAMNSAQIERMFGPVPQSLFRVHRWRDDLATLGHVPASYIEEFSEGKLSFEWPAQVNRLLVEGGHDLILSIGQVVPHEVIGMANYNKNIFVGTGGSEGISKSHYLGAVYGMERIMGRAKTPVRQVLNYASDHFGGVLPIIYVLTVVGRAATGELVVRGLFIGDSHDVFYQAAELSLAVNFEMLDRPIKKAVVFLDPYEFKSTWLGNKAIYRTRMALADGAELVVLAPNVCEFGEDQEIDRLIRSYGYCGTPRVLELVGQGTDLAGNLSAAAHLIHGSSEGRFRITYCPGRLSRAEVESVHFDYADLPTMLKRYDPEKLVSGYNTMPDGEEIFFVPNPALGLWAYRGRF